MMTDKSFKKSIGRPRCFNGKRSKGVHYCLICNENVISDSGYNILHTVMPHNGGILCDNINRILQRDIDAVTARSTILCNRCFLLLDEVNSAQERCIQIKKELVKFYTETAAIYNDLKPICVPGIGCQTDLELFDDSVMQDARQKDIKLKIALISKRKRGRPPRKSNEQDPVDRFIIETSKSSEIKLEYDAVKTDDIVTVKEEVDCIGNDYYSNPFPVEIKEETNVENSNNPVQRKSARNKDIKERTRSNKKISEPAKNAENNDKNNNTHTSSSSINSSNSGNEDSGSGGKNTDSVAVYDVGDDGIFSQDYSSCDDDFEWKDENGQLSSKSENVNSNATEQEDNSETNDENSSARKMKTKKRRRADRTGARAFMPPIHECPQCGKKWRTLTELKCHVASHSEIRPYICEICGQTYKLKKALDIHVGMHNGIHPFVCMYCNKSFTQKVGLEKHLPIHTGVARYQCDLCGKRFIHQKSFNIHKMTHTGERNIHCPVCNLAVFSQSHLKRHYRVHTGERPYECNICCKRFAEKYNLNAHIRIHDPNSPIEARRRVHSCPVCNAVFDQKKKLTHHFRVEHNMWDENNIKTEDDLTIKQMTDDNKDTAVITMQPLLSYPSASTLVSNQSQDSDSSDQHIIQTFSQTQRTITPPDQSHQPVHNPLEHHFLLSQRAHASNSSSPTLLGVAPSLHEVSQLQPMSSAPVFQELCK